MFIKGHLGLLKTALERFPHPMPIQVCERGFYLAKIGKIKICSPPHTQYKSNELHRILSANMTDFGTYSVCIRPMLLHTQYTLVNLPPLYIPPHTQNEYDQFLHILSLYTTNSSAYSVYIGRFPRILSMRGNVVSSTLNVN